MTHEPTSTADRPFRYSVIVPTYNRAQLVEKTIQALIAAAGARTDLEIIIVDDGSTDHTAEVVCSGFTAAQLTYIRQPDRGFRAARARNSGLRVARGSFAVLIDCGVIVSNDFFSALDDANAFGSEAIVFPVTGFSNDNTNDDALRRAVDAAPTRCDLARAIAREGAFTDIRERVFRLCRDDLGALPAPWAIAWTCCLAVPRNGPLGAVFFDEAFVGWGGEDLDFALQLALAGAEFRVERRAAALHLPHEKSAASNTRSSTVNKEYLHAKHDREETAVLRAVSAIDLNDCLGTDRG